jgi:hypothetical protein
MTQLLVANQFSGVMLVGDAGGVCFGRERSFLTASGVAVQSRDTRGVNFGDKFIAVGETYEASDEYALEGLDELFPGAKSVRAEATAISASWDAACVAVMRLALKAGLSDKSMAIRLSL